MLEYAEDIEHVGRPHDGYIPHSGRYPYGSGKTPDQHDFSFLAQRDKYKRDGMSEKDIANAFGLTVRQLRSRVTLENAKRTMVRAAAIRSLKDQGLNNIEIANRLGISEGAVRELIKRDASKKQSEINRVADAMKSELKKGKYLDVGVGTEIYMETTDSKKKAALVQLQAEGYTLHTYKQYQMGTGKQTTMTILCPPGVDWKTMVRNRDKITQLGIHENQDGTKSLGIKDPEMVSANRVKIRYAEDGGVNKDGCMELRPGVKDLNLGESHYAQVRIGVTDGKSNSYLKGVAVYGDPKDFPKGIDIIFNTNKDKSVPKMSVLKSFKDDPDNPFGAMIKRQRGALNIVNEEGDWDVWSKNLPSQFLSKQEPSFAKRQLDKSYEAFKKEYDDINSLTNKTVKRKLLLSFSKECDTASVDLKAAAVPRQKTHLILPLNSIKNNEVYAPNYNNGESLVLVRFPHGGIFELPRLTVNNKNREARRIMGNNPIDAIGINHKVAEKLSGADFDGDTVLCIPDNKGRIKTSDLLKELKGFDPSKYAKGPNEIKTGSRQKKKDPENYDGFMKQRQMGSVSNLITDMTIRGASTAELARAVKHSMVVIDAEKHNYDWKQSALDNDIRGLKKKYQGGANRGGSTLLSTSKKSIRVDERELARSSNGGPINKNTGEWNYQKTGRVNTLTGSPRTTKTTLMAETKDARKLSSGTRIENIYADYANSMKDLGNKARLSYLKTPRATYSPSAAKTYADEVASLDHKYKVYLAAKPRERYAQRIASQVVYAKRQANPELSLPEYKDALDKIKRQALNAARTRVGGTGKDSHISFTPREWEAVQAGAISDSKLYHLLEGANEDQVRYMSMPKKEISIPTSKISRIKAMANHGVTQADIAKVFGLSASEISKIIRS